MISASLRFSSSSICVTWSSVSFCTRLSAARSSSSPTSPFSNELLEMLDRVAAHVAHGDASLLGHLPHELDELLAPLLGQLRDRQPDQLAVVRRRQAEIRLEDRLLDLLDRRRVERLDRQHPRLRRVDRREVLERRRRAVVVDRDPVEQRRRRAAGAHRVEVLVRRLDRLVHALGRVANEILDHRSVLLRGCGDDRADGSPRATRPMLPGASSKTWIGRWLSMQSESAVVSITFNPRSIACKWVMRGISFASGIVRGSPSKHALDAVLRHQDRLGVRSRAPAAPPRCRS